ncbi:MAG: VWA domain-containing protein [Pseudomonadota bacterium]
MTRITPKAPANTESSVPAKSSTSDIAKFVRTAQQVGGPQGGRLIFALDATMSRQPTWDRASKIQTSMFEVAGGASGLAVQLVFFRGHGECKASKWVKSAQTLMNMMTEIHCRGGTTQIGKVLTHTLKETKSKKVSALIYIGDAMEENVDALCQKAGELGIQGVKAFVFQEGNDTNTEFAFREIARLSKGAYMRLDENSADQLRELLQAVAAYAVGGQKALESQSGKSARKLLKQLK